MKYNNTTIAIFSSLVMFSQVNAQTFNSIIHKHSYESKDSTLIPGKNESIIVQGTNKETGDVDSDNIKVRVLSLNTENGDLIELTSDVSDKDLDDRTLTGEWTAPVSITFIENTKNKATFYAPDFDGKYTISLKLEDGLYTKSYKSINMHSEFWTDITPIYGEWQTDKVEQDWSPDLNNEFENDLITQTRIIDRSRTMQEREERQSTGDIRNKGPETIDSENDAVETRQEYGLMEYWEPTDPKVLVDWAITEVLVDWTPDAANVYETEEVNQYREVKKERTIQDQEFRPKTGDVRTVGSSYKDTTLTNEYRTVQGELEYWENVGEVTCTEWALDRYDPWLPDASNYERHETVDQTRTKYESRECSGTQYRPATGEYREANQETEYRSEEESRTVYGTKIDLNDWFTNDSNGDWSVSNDGSYAYQAKNGNSTIFESASDSYGNTKITGKVRVRSSAGDDDWFGLVFGKYDDDNFILWAWKKANQGSSKEGHTLANVTGGVGAIASLHLDSPGYEVLDTNLSTTNGWNHNVYYNIEVLYTPTSISVKVGGTEVVSATGNFSDGKIGFYNLSQGGVEYYKVTDEPITD